MRRPFTFSFVKFDVKIRSDHLQQQGDAHMCAFKTEDVSPLQSRVWEGQQNSAPKYYQPFLRGQGKKAQQGWDWRGIKRGVVDIEGSVLKNGNPGLSCGPSLPPSPSTIIIVRLVCSSLQSDCLVSAKRRILLVEPEQLLASYWSVLARALL